MHRQRPRLKNGVDFQLQSAFAEGNWATVINLADKRFRSLKDPYYEIVKTCATSQLDDPSSKFSAVESVYQYVSDGTTIKDVDALDLLEWATLDLMDEDDFLETHGPLRVRAVKASPKDAIASTRCLESCLIHWDLASAQQIAAALDKAFPQERHYMFWNIVITYMLSTSPQATDDKKKLYGMLAFKQIERAAQAASSVEDGAEVPARAIKKEEEILLLYDIMETHGKRKDFEKLIATPIFSPLTHFRKGSKELFLRIIAQHRRNGSWDSIFQLCKECLSEDDEEGKPNLLASDYHVWQQFIDAASHIASTDETAAESVQSLLLKLIKSPGLRPIYKRNLLLARVSAVFQLASTDKKDAENAEASSERLQELVRYIEDQATSPACFDDIKAFVEKLDLSGMKFLSQDFLPKLHEKYENEDQARQVRLLSLKAQYLVATCPLSYETTPSEKSKTKCTTCSTDLTSLVCSCCFKKLWQDGLELYKDIATNSSDTLSKDPQLAPELVLLVAFCSMKLASPDPSSSFTALPAASKRHLFHAVLLLEYQLSFSPKNSQLLLVLVQLHFLLGSAPRARQLWDELGVKRTIMDSLGPLFYDRLSTVAPALLSPSDNAGWELMDMLTSHFSHSLKIRMPRRLIDAFEAETYSSVLAIPKYMNDLRNSATRVISLIEEGRAERVLGAPTWELFTDPRFFEVDDDTVLKETIDYGSFPSWDYSDSAPIYSRLRIGPPPTNRRAHLGRLAEAFHDVLGYKPPSSYKVPLASSDSDQTFIMESLSQVAHSFTRFLQGPSTGLTPAETIYYHVIGTMCTLVPMCAYSSRKPEFEMSFELLMAGVTSGLAGLRTRVPYAGGSSVEDIVSLLSDMHTVGIYRDLASGILQATQWLLTFNDRAKERDRSGQSSLPKDVIAGIKDVHAQAQAALKEGGGWVAGLRTHLKGDFQARFKGWVFDEAEALRDVAYEDIVPGLVANMRENVDGWQQVKWE